MILRDFRCTPTRCPLHIPFSVIMRSARKLFKRGTHSSVISDPASRPSYLQSLIEPDTYDGQVAQKLYIACTDYTNKYGASHVSSSSNRSLVWPTERSSAMAEIRGLADALEPESYIPQPENGEPSQHQLSAAWEEYATYVARLSYDGQHEFEKSLYRNSIHKDAQTNSLFTLLVPFLEESERRIRQMRADRGEAI